MNRNREFKCDWRRREITLWHDEHLFKWRFQFICENQWNRFHVDETSENENENEHIIDAFAIKKLFSSIFM